MASFESTMGFLLCPVPEETRPRPLKEGWLRRGEGAKMFLEQGQAQLHHLTRP